MVPGIPLPYLPIGVPHKCVQYGAVWGEAWGSRGVKARVGGRGVGRASAFSVGQVLVGKGGQGLTPGTLGARCGARPREVGEARPRAGGASAFNMGQCGARPGGQGRERLWGRPRARPGEVGEARPRGWACGKVSSPIGELPLNFP